MTADPNTTAPSHCPGPFAGVGGVRPTRRSIVQAGALALGGLSLSDLFRMQARAAAGQGSQARQAGQAGAAPSRQKSVLLVWLPGGPPHHETFDMKPEAPEQYRGIFRPMRTNVRGMEICELLPQLAKCADRYNIIRSVHHKFADHGGGHKRFLTGRKPATPTGFVNDAPAVTSCVAKSLEARERGVPNVVALTDGGRQGVDVFSLGAAYLGPAYTPFMVGGDPSDKRFEVRNISLDAAMANRLDDRLTLLQGMDRLRRDVDSSGVFDSMDKYNRRAMSLLTSAKMRDAFDLSKEPQKLRDRYGHHPFGQRALLGRRMIEAGSSFVTVVMENPGRDRPKSSVYNWDSHAVNCHIFEDAKFRFPRFDQAISALVEDIYNRGLDKDVMVIVTGEFGRTPKINEQVGTQTKVMQPGRDHWPHAMSMLVFGAGMTTGQVIGATDKHGAYVKERSLSPNDLWATAYRHLGIDYEHSFIDHTGRPMPILPFGEPIRELL